MDIFNDRSVEPMLIAEMREPFNNPNWIYELKLDGSRCIAYLDRQSVELRNKRNLLLIQKFPELKEIFRLVTDRCILDGELVVLKNGVPDFYELQRRSLLSDPFKIELASKRYPASFVAYDCLYYGGRQITLEPLLERKDFLKKSFGAETAKFAISRFVPENGIGLYNIADQKELEGVVAKRSDSLYFMGKRTKDWIKFKRMADEDYIVTGYIVKKENTFSIILGKYKNNRLLYKGHVTSGVTREVIKTLSPVTGNPFSILPKGNEDAIWVSFKVCTIEYMPNTRDTMRQPVWKGFRDDIFPEEVTEN
ncbi:DNA ligase [uncultured Robinsoniella sp.]|uniref:ATP-dependent DNA ligase n=1 Tax=uncultured Robinsoniella sp. TaxID=904190 RepID=UPI00374EA7B4